MTGEDAAKLGLATSTTHRTEYMKFLRSAGSDGNNRGKSAEMFNLKGASRTKLFNMWIVAGHDFCKVNLVIQQKHSNTQSARSKTVHMSKKQLEQSGKYTAEQITELIDRCTAKRLYQDDPNFPGNKELRQYEVVDEVSKTNTHSVEISQIMQGVSQLTPQEARSCTEAGQTEVVFVNHDGFALRGSAFMQQGNAPSAAGVIADMMGVAPASNAENEPAESKGKGKQRRKGGKNAAKGKGAETGKGGDDSTPPPAAPTTPMAKAKALSKAVFLDLSISCS